MSDMINHPTHYETGKYECIDVMQEAIGAEDVKGFCLCNAFKYIYRCSKKNQTPVEDVKKAVWYLNKFLELETHEGGSESNIRYTFYDEEYCSNEKAKHI